MTGLTPDITEVAVPRHGFLRLTFADGTRGEVEVIDRMRGPVFERARTPAGFAEVTVDTESGTVVWPGGADLAPDTLYVRIKTGTWPGAELAALASASLRATSKGLNATAVRATAEAKRDASGSRRRDGTQRGARYRDDGGVATTPASTHLLARRAGTRSRGQTAPAYAEHRRRPR